jgi:hypothetical protein
MNLGSADAFCAAVEVESAGCCCFLPSPTLPCPILDVHDCPNVRPSPDLPLLLIPPEQINHSCGLQSDWLKSPAHE